jgi:hypothetical protein
MQRKQQVGECWVCVIFFACVCVWVRQIRRLRLTIPSPRALPCAPGAFLGGSQGGQVCPPLVTRSVRGSAPKFFFLGGFLLFLADVTYIICYIYTYIYILHI